MTQPITWLTERRRAPRLAVRQRGYVVLAEHVPPLPCGIHELSRVGTLLRLDPPLPLPERFHLMVGGTELLSCRLARQVGATVGVEYIAAKS